MKAPDRPGQCGQVRLHAFDEVGMVIPGQHPAPYAPGDRSVSGQQVHRAVALVFPLPPTILPGAHRQVGYRAAQRLDLRLLVHADDQFIPLGQPRDPFVIPQDRGRLFLKIGRDGMPPVPKMVRMEVGGVQNTLHRGPVQRGDVAPLDLIMQRLDRPPDPCPADFLGRGAGQGDDLHPLEGGKAAADGHCGDGHTVRPTARGRSVCAISGPTCGGGEGPARSHHSASGRRPAGWRERAWPPGAPYGRSGRAAPRPLVHRKIRRSGRWVEGRAEAAVETTDAAAWFGSTSAATKGAIMNGVTIICAYDQKSCLETPLLTCK